LNLFTLEILDKKLAEEYNQKRNLEINRVSRILSIMKIFYGALLVIQAVVDH
jgi:hypothetical protein